MDPITLFLIGSAMYAIVNSVGKKGRAKNNGNDWKGTSSGNRNFLVDTKSDDGGHFTYNRKTKDLHATFDFGKTHVPIERGLGGLIEWDTLSNVDDSETRRVKLGYYRGLGVNFKPGEKFTYDQPWHYNSLPKASISDMVDQLSREREEKEFRREYGITPLSNVSIESQKSMFSFLKDVKQHSLNPLLNLPHLTPSVFDNSEDDDHGTGKFVATNRWQDFGQNKITSTNPWNSFNQPQPDNGWEKIQELNNHKVKGAVFSYDAYKAEKENETYWDGKVGCGFPKLSSDTCGYGLEDSIMKKHMKGTIENLMMTKEETSIKFSGIKPSFKTFAPGDFSLPKSHITW